MNIVFLFALSAAISLVGKMLTKLCSTYIANQSTTQYTLFLTVNGLVACLFFWISGGFHISINLPTLIYSLIYALIVTVSLISNIVVYKFATISGVNIITLAFGLVGSLMIGLFVFDEEIGAQHVIRVLILILAVFFVFFDTKKNKSKDRNLDKNAILPMVVVFVAMIFGVIANTVITKSFAIADDVTNANSFFFLTNVILSLGAGLIFAIVCIKDRSQFLPSIKLLVPKRLISFAGNTITSNAISLIGVLILAEVDVSVYSPISSAIGILISVLASLIFHERLGAWSYLAAATACVAMII